MNLSKLPFRNLMVRKGRTVALVALAALLTFSLFGGATFLSALRQGFASLQNRLGADIIVVPDAAAAEKNLEDIVLNGVPGFFYMDADIANQVASVPGVQMSSPQYFLATAKAGCCSMPLQIIGFDPTTDFSIQPWIDQNYSRQIDFCDIVIGSGINASPGEQLMFYGVDCNVVAQLGPTGTKMDYAVFCNADTIKALIAGSREEGILFLEDYYPDNDISTVQVQVAPDANIQTVADAISNQVHGATGITARAMTSGVAASMRGVSSIVSLLMVVLWVLAAAVLFIVFALMSKQRKREFAVLRTLGASRSQLSAVVIKEALIVSFIGAVVGIVLALLLAALLLGSLETALGLPFLVPSLAKLAGFGLVALAVTLIICVLASALAANHLSRVDAGQALREG